MEFTLDPTRVRTELEQYIRTEFLDGDPSAELTATSPLLDWGVLNSMNTARVIAFAGERFGVTVPPREVTPANFRDLESLARLVCALRGPDQAGREDRVEQGT
ncbi:MAG TPA: acyl carrier protein [Streptosporangiaceae bacterium]